MRALVLAIVFVAASSVQARAEPSDGAVVGVGLALALPDYVAGVSLHEGTHALAAKLVGADVDEMHLFPPGIDPHTHTFRFGWTYVHGLKTKRAKELFYIAPKITDSILLGAFAALVYSGAWPANRYGEVSLTVVGTGLWVDFSKDLFAFSKHNDVVKVLDLWCMKGWKQVPARIVYAGAIVAWGLVVEHAYERTFDTKQEALDMRVSAARPIVPLLTGSF